MSVTVTKVKNNKNSRHYSIRQTLKQKNIKIKSALSQTLQGQVLLCEQNRQKCVVKIASIKLHKNGITKVSKKTMKVQENIVKEYAIMKFLQIKDPPKGHVNALGFYKDSVYYVLAMEYAGKDLFKYVYNHTKMVHDGLLSGKFWINHVKKLFKQMCEYIRWLHNNNVCHLDISLENCLIKDDVVHFIDFGLAEIFNDHQFKCKKFVGKLNYTCQEVYNKQKAFDARKADIWSLGVCLFMMLTGLPLYNTPSTDDEYFYNVKNGFLREMIRSWNMEHMIPDNGYELFKLIFKKEKHRCSIDDILSHEFLNTMH